MARGVVIACCANFKNPSVGDGAANDFRASAVTDCFGRTAISSDADILSMAGLSGGLVQSDAAGSIWVAQPVCWTG